MEHRFFKHDSVKKLTATVRYNKMEADKVEDVVDTTGYGDCARRNSPFL